MASSVLDSWLTRLRALIVAQAIQAIRQWISQPPHFVGFMAFKGFLTVIQRKVQRHGDFLIRSHTARSEPNYTRRQQILTNTMPGQGKKKTVRQICIFLRMWRWQDNPRLIRFRLRKLIWRKSLIATTNIRACTFTFIRAPVASDGNRRKFFN